LVTTSTSDLQNSLKAFLVKINFSKKIWQFEMSAIIFAAEVLISIIATYPERWREMAR
jgi:hypothetical protein